VQQDLWQYYQTNYPGQVQLVGVDEYNGTVPQLRSFKNQTGATYPLLLLGATAPGGNFATLYGTFDNYVVVNKQGIVRYHAALGWSHGDRYHLEEIRGCIDSLVSTPVGVEPGPQPGAYRLRSAPNPARGGTTVELTIPGGLASHARVTVHDVSGRQVATVWDGVAPAGTNRFAWNATGGHGGSLPPGVYLIRAQLGAVRLSSRLVVLP
jgi:hypothetical protein